MTPAEAQKALEDVRLKRPNPTHLRLISGDNQASAIGAGEKLQNARLFLGLSVVQAAEALKLKTNQIEAIEAMNFSKMPGLGYALGYVRAYSELLDIGNVDAIVGEYREAWHPIQVQHETNRGISINPRLVIPLSGLVIAGLAVWGAIAMVSGSILNQREEVVQAPDAEITKWANKNIAPSGVSVVNVDPLVSIHALRDAHVALRGQDGALVADKNLKAGENLAADGLGRFILSTEDAGALEVKGYGQTISVGENHAKADMWRVPDLKALATAQAEAKAQEEKSKADAANKPQK